MTFDPDRLVREHREYLLHLGEKPGWLDYAEHQARTMAAEDHGLWKPLADVARTLKEKQRARHRM